VIQQIESSGKTCPVMTCDRCGERIVDAANAMVRWNPDDLSDVEVTHKSDKCDLRPWSANSWVDLDVWLSQLLHNVGYENADKRAKAFEALP